MELRQRLLLTALALACAVQARAADFPELSRLAGSGAQVTAALWDLGTDQLVASQEPAQRLIPASLSKIVIAAAALQTWPPDHAFVTELRSRAMPRAGVLEGDLVLRGSGDSTLDETTLWGLAAQLRSAGIRRINGRVLVERAPFGELGCDTIDRCSGLRRSSRAYNASPSAIGVNYGSWCLSIRGTQVGQAAHVGGCATGELPIALSGRVDTVASTSAPRVDRLTEKGLDRIAVGGTIAAGELRQIHRAMSDPAAGAGQILRSILVQTGIAVEGTVETVTRATTADQLLAAVDGLPVQEQVVRMMRYSSNYIADVLTMSVALQRQGRSPETLATASNVLTALVGSAGLTTGSPVMLSGSGLTTGSRLSALDLVGVLRQQYRDSRRFPAFYGSMVVPGDASFTALRAGGEDWKTRVALKTGSLTEPYSVNGIAGYLRRKDGGFMAFALLVNGSDARRQVPHDRALAAMRSDLSAMLVRY